MQVQIFVGKIAPALRQIIVDHSGEDIVQAYRIMRVDTAKAPAALAEALEAATKVPGSGVVQAETKNLVQPPAKPEVKSKPATLDEGGRRLQEHVLHNGLLPLDANIAAIKDWFAKHPDVPWNAANVDRCVFREIEEYLLWQTNNPGHAYWVTKLNPPPPPKPAPASKPIKVPKKLLYLKNGERRLPVPSPPEVLKKSSIAQLEDYRRRGGI